MTQNKETTLLDSIQSEVSREASPMLDFLIRHAKTIFLFLLVFIAAIMAFGVWNYMSGSKQKEAEEALGKILILPETSGKLAALEEYSGSAAPEFKNAALLAIAKSAALQNQPDKASAAWAELGKSQNAPLRLVAELARAGSLSSQGKNAEALALLDSLYSSSPADVQPVISTYIVSVAEALGDWDKAIAACDNIIRGVDNPDAKSIWEQRLAYFAAKK